MNKAINFEHALRSRGAIKIGEFTTRAGLPANCKLEIDDGFLKSDPLLADQIAAELSERMAQYELRVIVPVPEGANHLGELVARHLGIGYLALAKKEGGKYGFRTTADRRCASRASRVGVVDDVYTTGGALREVSSLPEFQDNVVAAGVIWDRSDEGIPKNLAFDLVSVIERYVSLRVGEEL